MLNNIEKYMTDNLSRVNAPSKFRPHIRPVYPPNNNLIFEEWFRDNYVGCDTDRVYLDIFPTSYWVNNDYGNDMLMRAALQDWVDTLPSDKKYFSICQYDDGFMLDWKEKDVLEFNMSKINGRAIPLVCQPHPFKFKGPKKWFANFVGGKTHPIRSTANSLSDKSDYYISFEPHDIERYCRILHESIFTLCYRGYGANSFRIAEALQYGSIPVYISDIFIWPSHIDDFPGIIIHENDVDRIDDILQSVNVAEIIRMQDRLQWYYDTFFTYDGLLKYIERILEAEYNHRKQV